MCSTQQDRRQTKILCNMGGLFISSCLIAVIRYFGGVKLGAGGLVRAYGTTAKNALEHCTIIPYRAMVTVNLQIGYETMDELKHILKQLEGNIISQDFGVQIQLIVQLPEDNLAYLQARFSQTY